jgi:hypothetical protein
MKSLICIIVFTCLAGIRPVVAQDQPEKSSAVVEVYYFHGSYRCPTCLAVEEQTKKVVSEVYGKQLENGTIELKVLNLEEKANQAVVEQFEIGWSSLILYKPGTKEKINLTEEGFGNARTDPEAFKLILKENIDKLLI